MAVGAQIGVRAAWIGTGARRRFPGEVSPDLDEVLRVVRDVFLLKILSWLQGKKLGEIPTPAITRSSLALCSAPSRLVALLRPRDRGRLSALTAPARRPLFGQLRDAGDAAHRASDDTIASACG
jgi:hypothetical protein